MNSNLQDTASSASMPAPPNVQHEIKRDLSSYKTEAMAVYAALQMPILPFTREFTLWFGLLLDHKTADNDPRQVFDQRWPGCRVLTKIKMLGYETSYLILLGALHLTLVWTFEIQSETSLWKLVFKWCVFILLSACLAKGMEMVMRLIENWGRIGVPRWKPLTTGYASPHDRTQGFGRRDHSRDSLMPQRDGREVSR